MDVYVARQPIFDRDMNIYGYELLYRRGKSNRFDGTDDSQATASLLDTSFLVIGFNELIGGTRGFINFSQEFLESGVPLLLPKDKVVIEVLERVEATDEIIAACRKLKDRGYMLALDDFILDQGGGGCAPLIELADIIKIEFSSAPEKEQLRLIRRYKDRIIFLAEKVETPQDYQRAVQMGYRLFQGYYFSRPIIINATDIGSLDINMMQILRELRREEPNFQTVAEIIEKDLGLSYKLLKMANSVYYGAKVPVKSIRQAVLLLGTNEMIQWIHLMLLKGVQKPENAELVKTSVIRGRMMSLMAFALGHTSLESDYFIVGIFSSLDVILNDDMHNIIRGLSLSPEAEDALLGGSNGIRRCLESVLALERADWSRLNEMIAAQNIPQEKFMGMYLDALRWQQAIQDS